MNKTKKNMFMKVSSFMLVFMMLVTCIISGTMAKYTSSGTLSDNKLSVAKWSIQAGSKEITELSADDLSFTIYDTDGDTTNSDDNVKADKIAPGTWGYATIEVENKGDVDASISAKFTKDGGSFPTGMKVTALSAEPTSATEISTEATDVAAATVKPQGTTKVVIAFVWDFGDPTNDANDTPIGLAASDLTLGSLTITADQVD